MRALHKDAAFSEMLEQLDRQAGRPALVDCWHPRTQQQLTICGLAWAKLYVH